MLLFLSSPVPLRMWELSNDAVFYAIPRPKLQPFWVTDEEDFMDDVDPCHGRYKIYMYYMYILVKPPP